MAPRNIQKMRILVVGAGRWGKVFLNNLEHHPRAQAAGLVSRQAREALPSLPPGAQIYASLEEALAAPWQGVILATPPETHAAQAELCVRAGIPVLVEKPLTLDLAEAEALQLRCQESLDLVLVDHTFLFNPGFLHLKKHLAAAGPIRQIFSEGGNLGPFMSYSPLWNYGAHDVAMILDLLESMPVEIVANARTSGRREGGLYGDYSCRLHFASDVVAEFRATNVSQHKVRRIIVQTDDEEFEMNDVPRHRLTRKDRVTGSTVELALPDVSPLTNVLNAFFDGIEGRRDSRWGLKRGVQVVEVLEVCAKLAAGS